MFANQMKTVFGEILDYDMVSEDGDVIDAVFGAESIAKRIVTSPYIIGTTTTVLKLMAKKAVAIYNS